MQISVIIPTYNRSKVLHECLQALFRQDFPGKDYEIIVVDDGSTDKTKDVVGSLMKTHENLHYHHQRNQGQGIARNKGVEHAKGDVIVFMGDDIIVRKDFLTEHIRIHLRHPEESAAALGLVAWHPSLKLTSFMEWLTNGSAILGKFGGHQFAFEKLRDKSEADYNFFYTSNISLKRNLADKYPFDPSFSGYGWEDIELGYRLHKRVGLKIYYNPAAIGYHKHEMTEDGLKDRMRSIGKSAWIIDAKYPELKKVPGFWKKIVFRLISNHIALTIFRFIRNFSQGRYGAIYYYALSKKYFMEGLKRES